MKKPHEILVTFYDGKSAKYTSAVLEDPLGIQNDPAVVEVVDLETGEIIFSIE